MLYRVSSWKLFLGGQPYTRPWPESVSEVSAECEFPARLIKISVMDELSSPTRDIGNSLSLSTQKWVMPDCLPRARESNQRLWLCNEPLLIQSHAFFDPVKEAKVMKAVHKVRNKDLVPFLLCLDDTSGTVTARREHNRQFRWNGRLQKL